MVDIRIGGLLKLSTEQFGKLFIRILGPLLLIVLFLLISFMTYVFFSELLPFLVPIIGLWSVIILGSVGILIIFNIVFNYILCVLIGPGYPPDNLAMIKCGKCKGPKPLRSHHCSVCNKCVLKMDHHCPWIMNCVGHKNHRYFLLFLFYVTLGCIFITFTGYTRFYTKPRSNSVRICFVLAFVFSIVLFLFTAWHALLILSGSTTIEMFAYYGGTEDKHKYNFSRGTWRKNFETVFGTNSLIYALLPSCKPLIFDGINWPDTLHSI